MKNRLKNTKGITLVALIITIIVLLILAMVSIRLVMNGGIINRAQEGTKAYTIAEEKEQIQLGYQKYQMSKYTDQSPDLTVEGAQSNGDETNGWDIVFPSNNQYHLDKDGNITGPTTSNTNVSTGPVTNPYSDSEWLMAWVYQNGSWSSSKTPENIINMYNLESTSQIEELIQNQISQAKSAGTDLIIARAYMKSETTACLVIEGNGQMGKLVDYEEDFCYGWQTLYTQRKELLTEAIICDGVTNIGDDAFWFCPNLSNIIISNSVTSIGAEAFYGCTNLSSINLPNSVTNIGQEAFERCTSLSNITIPNGVTTLKINTFMECSSLRSVTIPNSVTTIGDQVFEDCVSLNNINLPNSVTSIGNSAFGDCTNLSNITIPNSVTSIGNSTFSSCTNLSNIIIPNSVTTMGTTVFGNWTSSQTINICRSQNDIPSGWNSNWNGYSNAAINWDYQGQ